MNKNKTHIRICYSENPLELRIILPEHLEIEFRKYRVVGDNMCEDVINWFNNYKIDMKKR